jgi:hypothetical protein
MIGLLGFALAILAGPFKSKMRLEAENAVLRQQLIVLRRRLHGRVRLTNSDRWFFILLYRWFPSILQVLTIIRPETLIRWHRSGFRCYWRWKSRSLGGRPQIEAGLRALIRRMSMENPLWGAPRIHGELLKLGFQVAQSSVAKYMIKRRGPPSQGWWTFLRNHAPDIAAMDFFVVPTIGSTCSTPSSSSDWTAETWSGSTSQGIRRRNGLRVRSRRPFPGMRPRNISFAIVIVSMAPSLRADCAPWASGTSLPQQPRLGRMALPNG